MDPPHDPTNAAELAPDRRARREVVASSWRASCVVLLIMSYLIGWIFIGLAASLGASLWPFRRGLLGIAMNIGAGTGGAVGLAHVGIALGLSRRDPLTMAFAGVGAFVMLAIAHGIWQTGRKGNRDAPDMLSRP